ncbi:MAG: hypothetical protein RI985_1203 [Chloroflexota bacterium]|jgi:hypothetical protein
MLTTIIGVIIVIIAVVAAVVWGITWLERFVNSAYERMLTTLANNPRDEATIMRTIQMGRDYYFQHDTYQRLPANSLLQNMSILNELRERNPYLHDEKIKKDMRNATRINYDNFLPKRPQPDAEPPRKV